MRTTPLLSANSLIIMNIENYLAIIHPFFHHSTVTKRKMIWSFGILGCISLICAAIIFVWHSIGKLIYSVLAFIICSTTLFQYVSIFVIARKAYIRIRRITDVNIKKMSCSSLRLFLRDLKNGKDVFLYCFLMLPLLSSYYNH